MKLSNDAVKVSVVSFGESANLEISEGNYNGIYSVHNLISDLKKVSGSYRVDLAFDLAYELTQSNVQSSERHAVLFVTQANFNGFNTEVLGEKVKAMKSSGIDVFTVLMNQSNKPIDDYLSVVSRPVEKHFFEVKTSQYLSKWPTTTARALCRNVL